MPISSYNGRYPMECLDDGQVMDFVHRQLPPELAQQAEAHVGACATCRALVAEAVRSSSVEAPVVPSDEAHEVVHSAHFAVAPVVGQLLAGRFRLEAVLGRGGMGVVYRARDERLDVTVALKLLAPASARTRGASSSSAKQLLRELRVTRSINHPHVCRVFDVGEDGAHTFITMEVIDGETLESAAMREPFSPERAVATLLQVCEALEAAHRENVVHRDLKPSNIMVATTGHVTVMDFGLARDLSVDASASTQGGAVGTPAYWAPEQARGEGATYQSDVFSVGLIAYRLLVGDVRAPFPTSEQIGKLRAPFDRIIKRCLEPDPRNRFASVAALRQELARAGQAKPNRGRLIFAIATLAFLTIATLGALFVRSRDAQNSEGASRAPAASSQADIAVVLPSADPHGSAPSASPLPSTSTSAPVKAAPHGTSARAPSPTRPSKRDAGRSVVPVVD